MTEYIKVSPGQPPYIRDKQINDALTTLMATATAAATAVGTSVTPTATLSETNVQTALERLAGPSNVLASSINGGALDGFRNKIINGDMSVNQVPMGSITTVGYPVDRWGYSQDGEGTSTSSIAQQASGPNREFPSSLKLTVLSSGSRKYSQLIQPIEGVHIRDLFGVPFTVSFWVKASIAGVYCVALNSGNNAKFYVAEYTITSSNVWQKISLTVVGGLPDTSDFATGTSAGLVFRFLFTVTEPSLITTETATWVPGLKIATANQVNMYAVSGSTFEVTGVQIEVGSVATPFTHRPYPIELALCRRYFSIVEIEMRMEAARGGQTYQHTIRLPEQMRAVPTITPGGAAVAVNVSAEIWAMYQYESTEYIRVGFVSSGAGDCYVSQRTLFLSAEM